jgi:hypothetical protein
MLKPDMANLYPSCPSTIDDDWSPDDDVWFEPGKSSGAAPRWKSLNFAGIS